MTRIEWKAFWTGVRKESHDHRLRFPRAESFTIGTFVVRGVSWSLSAYCQRRPPNLRTTLINSRSTACMVAAELNDARVAHQKVIREPYNRGLHMRAMRNAIGCARAYRLNWPRVTA